MRETKLRGMLGVEVGGGWVEGRWEEEEEKRRTGRSVGAVLSGRADQELSRVRRQGKACAGDALAKACRSQKSRCEWSEVKWRLSAVGTVVLYDDPDLSVWIRASRSIVLCAESSLEQLSLCKDCRVQHSPHARVDEGNSTDQITTISN